MFKQRLEAQAMSEHIDTLLAGETPEDTGPVIDTARLLAKAAPKEPSGVFYHSLKQQLLQAGHSPQSANRERSTMMWKRLAAVGTAALLVIVAVWMAWPRTLTPQQVLARAAKTTAAEPGQIIYQVYSSGGSLYREWQRLETAPDGGLLPVEVMIIRYAKHDTAFESPLDWVYNSSDRSCRWPLESATTAAPESADAEGCKTVITSLEKNTEISTFTESSAPGSEYTEAANPALRQEIQEALRETPGTPGAVDVASVQTIREQIQSLQANSGNVSVVRVQLEERPVYAIEESQPTTRAAAGAVTRTLFVDQKSFLPVGLSYTSQAGDGEIISWSALVFEYRVVNASELDFDPFTWPPAKVP